MGRHEPRHVLHDARRRGVPVTPRVATGVATPSGFIAQYGSLFGVDDPTTQLRADPPWRDPQGFTHTTMWQVYRGVSEFGGVVKTPQDSDGDFDNSGRVDLGDHAAPQRCLGLPISENLECQGVNFDNDETVSLADHAPLISRLLGP